MDHTTAFQEYEQSALEAIAATGDAAALEAVRIEFLGKKKGRLKDLQAVVGKVSAEERPVVGKAFNEVKTRVSTAFDALKAETENRVEVTLIAASPVDDATQSRIVDSLKQRFGRDVSLTFELDESLIGGARLQADDLVIDGSVRAGLDKLATTLAN